MDLKKITEALDGFLKEKELKLFEASYRKSDNVLSVLLDEKLEMDRLEEISNQISAFLDSYEDEFVDNYFLDVSTVGVERPIRNIAELKEALGKYIYVKTKENEYYGTLLSLNEGIMELETREKNRTGKVSVDYNDTKNVRYAVDFKGENV